MNKIRKVAILVFIISLISIYGYHLKIQKENLAILEDMKIWQTENLENIVSIFDRPAPEATRLYTYALIYRAESLKSRSSFLKKLVLPENYIFCADKKIINLLFPYIFENDKTVCEYSDKEEKIIAELKEKFDKSVQNEQLAINNYPYDFSGTDPTKWFQENSIIPPTTPYAGYWETFFLNLDNLPELTPPEYESSEDLREVEKVKEALEIVTEEQKTKVEYWAGGKGTATPLGIWFKIIEEEYSNQNPIAKLNIKKDASIAAHDAMVTCWNLKFKFMTKRPFMRDDNIVSQIMTPTFPSYPSGHATMSGAVSTVLEEKYPIYGKQGIFYDLAQEAADSRLWGGIHFDIDNKDGLEIGKFVGRESIRKAPHF